MWVRIGCRSVWHQLALFGAYFKVKSLIINYLALVLESTDAGDCRFYPFFYVVPCVSDCPLLGGLSLLCSRGCFDSDFSVRLDKLIDVLLATATESRKITFGKTDG